MLPPLEDLYVISADYRRAPIEFREALAYGFHAETLPEERLVQQPGIREALWLETCDRVEAVVLAETEVAATAAVQQLWWQKTGIDTSRQWERFFVHRASGAFRHLTRIACGLDLAYPGSRYAMDEWEKAETRGLRTGTARTLLQSILSEIQRIGNRLQKAEQAPLAPYPAVHAVLAMLSRYFGPLAKRSGLVIGSGLLAEKLCQQLRQEGIEVKLTGTRPRQFHALAQALDIGMIPLSEFSSALAGVDFLVAASSDTDPDLLSLDMQAEPGVTQAHPLLAIDLSFPRVLRARPGTPIFLYDTDQLSRQWREREETSLVEREALVTAELASIFRMPPRSSSNPRSASRS